MSSPSSPQAASAKSLLAIASSAAAVAGLAVYQWFELLEARKGHLPGCAVSETVNCVTVWNSPFASRIHELTGIPVAGLGLAWSLSALVLAFLAWRAGKTGHHVASSLGAVKLWAAIGAFAVVTFVTASVQLKVACPLCLGTDVLVALHVAAAFVMLPGPPFPSQDLAMPSVARAAVAGTVGMALMLYPGSQTPHALKETLEAKAGFDAKGWFEALPDDQAKFASYARELWRTSKTPDVSGRMRGLVEGSPDARVKIVDFTDVLCPHCAMFEQNMAEFEKVVPQGSYSLEPRYFPLDGACNRTVKQTMPDPVRCVGPKVQICLEKNPEQYARVRREMFARQQELTSALVYEIAVGAGADRKVLEACVASDATQARLDDDIAYALAYELEGTPLVLVNGRKTEPSPAFLLGMVLSGGDPNASYFARLPPPPLP